MNSIENKLKYKDVHKGGNDFFEDIYRELAKPLYRFIYLKVSSSQIAEELMQEAFIRFIKIVRRMDHGLDELNIKAYIYKIARNLIKDHYRVSGQMVTVEMTEALGGADKSQDPQIIGEMQLVVDSLEEIKPLWRDIIILKEIQGLNLKEISYIIGKSYGATRVLAYRALKELRQIIKSKVNE